MNLLNILLVLAGLSWLVWAWRTLPSKMALAHESFRTDGDAPVFKKDELSGRLLQTDLRLTATDCMFADKATFVLLFPCIRSKAVAGDLQVEAVTRWPTMKTYFVLQ